MEHIEEDESMPRKTVKEEAEVVEAGIEEQSAENQPEFGIPPFDNVVKITIDTPKALWGAFGHVALELTAVVEGPVDLTKIYLRALEMSKAALEQARKQFADYLEEYYASLPSAQSEENTPSVSIPNLSGLSPEQAREFALEIAPKLPGNGGVVAKFLETAKRAGIFMKKASPQDAQKFMDFARALAAGHNPEPPGKVSLARQAANKAARSRRQNPFA